MELKGTFMALPKQVEAQMKELEALEKQLEAGNKPLAEDAGDDTTPTEPEDPKSQEAAPTKPVEVKPAPVEPDTQEETWQQRYKTLKGMYDAEVPRLHGQMKELKAEMDAVRKAAETKKAEPTKPVQLEKLVTDEDVQAFGADLIEVQRKVAREVAMEFRGDIDDLRAENEKLREQLTQTGTQISESSFEQRLHRAVPDFDAVNADPKWVEWLNEVDPLLRAPRKTIAQQAFSQGDAEGVAHYVKLFKATQSAAPAANLKAEELERQIQPTKAAASGQVASQKGRIYTNTDIEKMFAKAANLGASGKPEEARKLEAEIDSAFTDGRVTA